MALVLALGVTLVALAAVGFGIAGLAGKVRQGGLAAIVLGLVSALGGLVSTVVGLVGSFHEVSHVPAEDKATRLADGISHAMWATAVGLAGGALAIVLGLVALLRRRSG